MVISCSRKTKGFSPLAHLNQLYSKLNPRRTPSFSPTQTRIWEVPGVPSITGSRPAGTHRTIWPSGPWGVASRQVPSAAAEGTVCV